MMNTLITVIVPTFNRKTIVLEAINSVLNQEPKNYEVIVVDDGSTDETKEYLESLNLPITVIRKENGGISSTRNAGIKVAKGKYIAFLDSDDLWLPGILKAQSDYLEENPDVGLVYTDQYIESFGKMLDITRFSANPTNHEQKSKYTLPALVDKNPIHASVVMVRKSVFDDIGLFDERLKVHEDVEMWNRISEKYPFGYIEKPFGIFRWEKDPEHVLNPKQRRLFVNEGKKYLKIYEDRRKNKQLSYEEKEAIITSHKRIDQLEELVTLQEQGIINEEEFNRRKDLIFK